MSLSCSMSTFIHTNMNDWMTECYFSYGMWRRQKLQVLSRNVSDVCRIIILSIIFTLPFTVSWTKPHRIFVRKTTAFSIHRPLDFLNMISKFGMPFVHRGYIFYAGGSLAGAGYSRQCRRLPAILPLQLWQGCQVCVKISAQRLPRVAQFYACWVHIGLLALSGQE